ncbi:M23 family metallopeptidase [Halarcobacter bivalviorum]|uniref:Peptidase M23 n=1 Tax=Halarcobacter bivalviorum TaxID=663364 RepID=A0AAX2ACD4_9BACT|nr:M23 family metallopeptidase [Halarcobacter bivalviorum]AXH12741.1 zinc metallopeptidase, M23 family [Halarcobacter bivalviorum]RXK10341.1 peptidase M23 [Halarcobacter bivalviorum]
MKKILILLFIINQLIFALDISSQKIKNANTLFLKLEEKNIKNPKLTIDSHNIDFFEIPNKKDSYYALVPISYYKEFDKYKIIVSYIKNNKKVFKGINIEVIDGNYKSEIIKVTDNSKVTLNDKNKKRVDKEYKRAMNIYNKTTPKLYIKDDFIYPINSKITSDFGKKRVYNGTLKSYHSGTDFRAKNGTIIKAINNGKIVIAEDRFYAGKSIVIDHGQGIYSGYYHLSKKNFKVGDFVKKGDIIGLSGSTGRITGPHLHFSFRIHGILVDPLQAIELLNNNL